MIDTSFLLGPDPTPLLTPYDVQARKLAIRNALAAGALQDQAVQTGGLELQARRQAMADEARTRAALSSIYGGGAPSPTNALAPPPAAASSPGIAAPAPLLPSVVPDPAGAGVMPSAPPPSAAMAAAPTPVAPSAPVQRPPVPTMGDLIRQGVPYSSASAVLASLQKVEENAAAIGQKHAETAKAQGELQGMVQEQGALSAQAIIDSNYNPAVIAHQLQHFAANGPEYQALAAGVAQRIQANPADMPALFQSMAAAGKGNREAKAAETTADAHMLTSRATAAKDVAELPGIQADSERKTLVNAASKLGAATNRDDYAKALAGLAQTSPSLAAQFPAADKWTAQTRGQILNLGMSAQEQVTTAETAKRDAQTAANENAHLSIERGNLTLAQSKQAFDTAAIQRTAHALASGDLTRLSDVASLRGDQRLQIFDLAKQENPNFNTAEVDRRIKNEAYYADGKGAEHLQSFNTFLEHGGSASDAVNQIRLSGIPAINKPLNWWRTNLSGSPQLKQLQASLEPVRKEFEGFLLGGRALEGDDRKQAEIILNENSSPAQIQQALKTMGHTAMARMNEENYRYKKVSGHDLRDPFSPEAMQGAKSIGLNIGAPAAPAASSTPITTAGGSSGSVSVQHMSTDELLKALVKK